MGEKAMPTFVIHITTEKCTGCLRCELACSDLYMKSFNPSLARIHVVVSGADCSIDFTDECVACGVCADHCFYGALEKVKREEDE